MLTGAYGDPYDSFWSCHVGLLLCALGLAVRGSWLPALAFLWMVLGTGLWFLDVLKGGAVGPLTLLLHGGGLTLSGLGVWRRRWPRGWVWWQVILGLLALQHLCRLVTPPKWNVNLAFGIQSGWEGDFEGYWLYLGLIVAGGAVFVLLCEVACRRLLAAPALAEAPGAEGAEAGGPESGEAEAGEAAEPAARGPESVSP